MPAFGVIVFEVYLERDAAPGQSNRDGAIGRRVGFSRCTHSASSRSHQYSTTGVIKVEGCAVLTVG